MSNFFLKLTNFFKLGLWRLNKDINRRFLLRFSIKVSIATCIFLYFFFLGSNFVGKYDDLNFSNNVIPKKVTVVTNITKNSNKQFETHHLVLTQQNSNQLKHKIKKKKLPRFTDKQLKFFVKGILKYHGVKVKYTQQIYNKICNYNKILCSKIHFNNVSFNKKVEYLAIIQFVVSSLDKHMYYKRTNFTRTILNITVDGAVSRRGFAGHNIILLNIGDIKSNTEFLNVLTHELGHIFDLGVLNGISKIKSSKYTEFGQKVFSKDDPSLNFYSISWLGEHTRRAGMTVREFVSGYGMTDPFEDFAETFNAYMNHYLYFKYLALNNYVLKMKFDFIDRYFGGFHFFDDKKHYEKVKLNPSWRPRDSTTME